MDANEKSTKSIETVRPEGPEIKAYHIYRDGARDLRFCGQILGEGSYGTGGNSGYQCDWNRGVDVRIYRTVRGKYVMKVYRWSQWQGEGESHDAEVCDNVQALYVALCRDDGKMPPASKEAWEAAARHDEAIRVIECEEVE